MDLIYVINIADPLKWVGEMGYVFVQLSEFGLARRLNSD
jgi:hypothetical protein